MASKIKVDPTVPQVGQNVQYTGRDNIPFAARILMTQDTYQPERDQSGLACLTEQTNVSLVYERPFSGRRVVRHNVPLAGSEAHQALVAKDQAYQDYKSTLEMEQEPEGAEFDATGLTVNEPDAETEAPTPPERVAVRSWNPIPA